MSRTARRRSHRWDTWPAPRAEVLGVARTLTSATRVLDVLGLLRREDGIDKYCTVNPGSAFAEGLGEYLASTGVTVIDWREATRRPFDLAVSCAVHPSLRQLDAPLMVLPHGAGYNRLVTESTGGTGEPAGLSRRELTHRGKVIPAVIGLSHHDQLTRLARSCPEAAPHACVVGDWCLQRIRASLPLRDAYRARLGAGGGRRLVVLHSTWSEHSLLGRHPDLPLELVTQLPADEFAVAAVLHPNVWARHSRLGVYERFAQAMDAGLRVIPPQEGWRAAVVAGDWVVGDHGSTTFYSAALDRLTLLAATGLDELDPLSPAAAFARQAPRLDPEGDLYAQLLDAERKFDRGALRPVIDGQLEDVDRSGELTRERMYAFLAGRGVRPPSTPPVPTPVPEPEPVEGRPAATYDVTGDAHPDGVVDLERRPVVAGHHREARGFYAAAVEQGHRQWRQSAEVVARTAVDADAELPAVDWLSTAADDFPDQDVLVAAVDEGRALVRPRGGLLLEAHAERTWGAARPALDPLLLGAAVHVWLVGGGSEQRLLDGLLVRTGRRHVRIGFRAAP
ncbi:hypothetical protein AB0J38_32340 [Streptomyces sp. NPDC050095]|uniref:hypothetical protein n=1 Tax=unclassified Streptomyces TaxID=2593676 RepID=UPI0034174D31